MPSKEAGHCVRAVVGCWGGGNGGGRVTLFSFSLFFVLRLLLRSDDMVTKRMAKSCSNYLDDVC